jgi:hypothetical protein
MFFQTTGALRLYRFDALGIGPLAGDEGFDLVKAVSCLCKGRVSIVGDGGLR